MSRLGILSFDDASGKVLISSAVAVDGLPLKESKLLAAFVKAAGVEQSAEDLANNSDGQFSADQTHGVFESMISILRARPDYGERLRLHQYFGFEGGLYHGYKAPNDNPPGHPENAERPERVRGGRTAAEVEDVMAAARARIVERAAEEAKKGRSAGRVRPTTFRTKPAGKKAGPALDEI